MNSLDAGLLLNFVNQPDTIQTPFVLQTDEDRGAVPIQVRPATVPSWSREPEAFSDYLPQALIMEAPGRQRIRLYCPKATVSTVRLLVQGGSSKRLGRRQKPIVETLIWVRGQNRKLRYHYDQPTITIVDHTRFFNADGQESPLPVYDQSTGTFHHAQEVTGALVVRYAPGFLLYEIEYDVGESQIPAEWLREMKLAWLAGNIHTATIPPVRVIAMGTSEADQLTFPRIFWPSHAMTRTGYRSTVTPQVKPNGSGYTVQPQGFTDPCWQRCKEKIQPNGNQLSAAQMQAVRNCVAAEKSPKYHYVEASRIIRTERLFAPDNADLYIDVARPVEIVMRLQRADEGVCDNHPPPSCCPELRLRFDSGL